MVLTGLASSLIRGGLRKIYIGWLVLKKPRTAHFFSSHFPLRRLTFLDEDLTKGLVGGLALFHVQIVTREPLCISVVCSVRGSPPPTPPLHPQPNGRGVCATIFTCCDRAA